jgi:acyl carrier protein
MKGSDDAALKFQLKNLIAVESDRGVAPESIGDDDPLFGRHSDVDLDSLDTLQLIMAIQKSYGVRIAGGNEARRVFATVNTLADAVQPE